MISSSVLTTSCLEAIANSILLSIFHALLKIY